MVDNFDGQEVQSSGELWSQICSSLPEVQDPETPGPDFTDSFRPAAHHEIKASAQVNGTSAQWRPMDDSESYLASLENRLKRIKGQSCDVTSRDILRSLSQAKKECWDRFLHDAQTSELFQSDDMDESALEHFKRWLIPEKVAISAEELEYLLRPSQSKESTGLHHTENEEEAAGGDQQSEEDDSSSPEK